jgi:toxin HigB-1
MKKLWMIDAVPDIKSLRVPPSNHLELLKGDREGQYSIRINMQWRICFTWKSGDAYEIEIVDYH